MILYAALFCMGIGMHLSQVFTNEQPNLTEECDTILYVAAESDGFYNPKLGREYLASLNFEYPLYMGIICVTQNRHLNYYQPPEAVFHNKILDIEIKLINKNGRLYTDFPAPWDERKIVSPEVPEGCIEVLVVHSFDYFIDDPRFIDALKYFLEEESFLVIREEKNAYPDLIWRPTFKYGTYNPYGDPKEIYEYFEGKNATDLVVRDW